MLLDSSLSSSFLGLLELKNTKPLPREAWSPLYQPLVWTTLSQSHRDSTISCGPVAALDHCLAS
jgi:hypothetical protein